MERPADVLVLATGFEMSNSPVVYRHRPVKGRNGFDLADFYENHRAAAYEGVTMPGLPNTFMVFGPYAWSGSSWHVMVENASRHAVRVIEETLRRGSTAAEISVEANDRFHRFVDARGSDTLMHGRACIDSNSYYIDRNGDFSFAADHRLPVDPRVQELRPQRLLLPDMTREFGLLMSSSLSQVPDRVDDNGYHLPYLFRRKGI